MMPNLYRSSDEGLAAFMRWAGVTAWATVGQAIDEAVKQGWLTPVAEESGGMDETQRLRAIVAFLQHEAAGAHAYILELQAALLTIASQDWPDGMKAWQYAQLVLWGPLCYWCRGFGHPQAWTGCTCKEDEPWD